MTLSTKIKRVTIRMTYREHEKLLEEAKSLNLNVSDFIRMCVLPMFMSDKKGKK